MAANTARRNSSRLFISVRFYAIGIHAGYAPAGRFGSTPGSPATLAPGLSVSDRKHAGIIAGRDFGSAPGSSATLARELSFSHPDSVRRCARLSENNRFSTPHLRTATPAAPHGPGPHEKPPFAGCRPGPASERKPPDRIRRTVRSSRRRPDRRHRRCLARCRHARSAPRPRPPSTGS